ncbi:pyridoxal 5'-phosphate synthase glutaminase subunit PdxT [bacterium]|nr:pyridoxal 5'-phosphate synthase glutaminase subunit PdxT [bacterium]
MKKIGVLALQGDFEAHQKMLAKLSVESVQIRTSGQLDSVDGLIIPGGESTTLIKLMRAFDLIEPIREFHKKGKPIFGTCAGSILAAKNIRNSEQFRFGLIDITVERNGYGRQVNSFECDVATSLGPELMHAVFIRAPKIIQTGSSVEILAAYEDAPIAARENQVLVATFHPELTDDIRLHQFFIEKMVGKL